MWPKSLYRRLRHPLVVFAATASVLLATLTWLAWRSLEKDQALASQRIQERLDNHADLAAAALRGKVSDLEEQMAALANLSDPRLAEALSLEEGQLGNEALIVVVSSEKVDAYPRSNLRYYPILPASPVIEAQLFAPGEDCEFQQGDYAGAAAAYRELTSSEDEAIRAEALVRLGRVLRKASEPEAALDAYRQLAELSDVAVGGVPAELLARHARCVLFGELGQSPELQLEAKELLSGLRGGKWPLRRPGYRFYEQEAHRFLDSEPLLRKDSTRESNRAVALAAGVERLWNQWQRIQRGEERSSGCRNIWLEGTPVLLMWQAGKERLLGLVAQPDYVEQQWLAQVQGVFQQQDVRVGLADADGRPVLGTWADDDAYQALRTAAQAELPWTLQVSTEDTSSLVADMAERRRPLLIGLAAVAVLVLAAGYAIFRSVSREIRVARLQADFVSAVSHEFRTPLASLRQLSELLAEGRVPNEQRRAEYYRALRRESERLHRLVEDILDFGRMEAGAREYRLQKLDPETLVRDLAGEFAQELQTEGYCIEVQVEESLPCVNADREALGRAIWNLLDNAVKYSPNSKTVWVEASREGDQVAIRVRDRGLGIAPGEQRQIFDKFFRASSAKVADAKGTGLGLAMVHHTVAAHGGKLLVESQVEVGSTFTILLPSERDSE